MAKGQHKYLTKGGGKTAAVEAGKVHQEKIDEMVAREDIAKYSLSHAKKKGLVAAPSAAKEESTVEWVYEDELPAGNKQTQPVVAADVPVQEQDTVTPAPATKSAAAHTPAPASVLTPTVQTPEVAAVAPSVGAESVQPVSAAVENSDGEVVAEAPIEE